MFNGRPNTGNMRRRPWKFLLIPFAVAGMVFLLGTVVQYLWNNILTPVAGVGALSFWQAVGLLVLCRLLFGGFGGGRRGGWGGRHRGGPPAHLQERWMQMSDEERARFQEEWKQRCRPRGRREDSE